MPTITYQGPADGGGVRFKGKRFAPGKPVQVSDSEAKALMALEGYKFKVDDAPTKKNPDDDDAAEKPKSRRSKATR